MGILPIGSWPNPRFALEGKMKKTLSIAINRSQLRVDNLKLADVLPAVAKPWFSMGDKETLTAIGRVLDTLPAESSGAPAWEAAMKIVDLHTAYAGPDGGYSKEYSRCETGYYSPGECLAAPIYNGRFQMWNFHLSLKATVGRMVQVTIGRDSAGCLSKSVLISFGNPSYSSASQVRDNLKKLGVHFEADEVEVPDEEYWAA